MLVTAKSGTVYELADAFSAANAIAVDCMVSPEINGQALSKCYLVAAIRKIGDEPVDPMANSLELQSIMRRVPVRDLSSLSDSFMKANKVPSEDELREKYGEIVELNALEASNVDTYREDPSGLALSKMYIIAGIRSVNGASVDPLELNKDNKPDAFNRLAESITLAEMNGLIGIYNKADQIGGQQLKNSSAAPGESESQGS